MDVVISISRVLGSLGPKRESQLLTIFLRARKNLWRVRDAIGPFLFASIGSVSFFAYLPRFRTALTKLSSPQEVQLAVGALIGTVLTLGFSLSIIPIQRAAEIYTPSIIRLFREARSIRFTFLALLFLCLLSFGSALSPLVGISPTATVPILIIFLGITLDLLRQLYRSVTSLLEPKQAVWRLEAQARDKLQRFHRGLELAADLAWRSLPAEKQKEFIRETYLRDFYRQYTSYGQLIETPSAELAEIAEKAVERADWSLTLEAINALRQLAIDSVEIRKSTFTYMPVEFMGVKVDAETQLDRLYEQLLAVNRTAVRRGSENVCLWVIRSFGQIAQHMMSLRKERLLERSGLATSPISYCKMAIREAMAANMDDAGYEGAATLAAISRNAPANTAARYIHAHTIEGISEILKTFAMSTDKGLHLREPLKRGLEVLQALCERRDPNLDHTVRSVLEQLEGLLPGALLLETGQFGELLYLPLGPAYDVSFEASLPRLVQRSTAMVKEDPERPGVNPWRDFLDLNDKIARHFRTLSENAGLAASGLMFYLIQAQQMIGSTYVQQLVLARRKYPSYVDKIERQLAWFLSFFWSTARAATTMKRNWSEDAVNCLGWLGLASLNEGFNDTATSVAQNITAIAFEAAEKIKPVRDEDLARLLIPLRLMAWLASEIGATTLFERIQDEEKKVIAGLTKNPNLKTVLDHEEQEKRQELIFGRDAGLLDPNDPEALLLEILHRRGKPAADRS